MLHIAERESFAVTCIPEATQAEVLARYPQAVAAEPRGEVPERPVEGLTVAEQSSIRRWLHCIGEADPRTVAEVVRRCEESAGYRRHFLGRGYLEHSVTAPEEAHAESKSVQHAKQPAPLRHSAATVAKSYTETIPRRAGNG